MSSPRLGKTRFRALIWMLAAASCSNPTEKIMKIDENTWGLEFKSPSIDQADPQMKKAGQAVVLVEYADGGVATGFFISPDGLLLTNHHVIPRNRCTQKRCAGMRFIRNFTPNGAIQIYNQFEVLAQNEELDFALVQVNVEKVETPYLTLSIPDLDKLDSEKLPKAHILGHPWGASLRFNDAILNFADNTSLEMDSSAISGNSGSPILDKKMQVLGLYHSGEWVKNTVTTRGKVKHSGYGTPMLAITTLLGRYFPTVAEKQKAAIEQKQTTLQLMASDFKTLAQIKIGEVLPKTLAPVKPEGILTRETFTAQDFATIRQQAGILALGKSFSEKADPEEYFAAFDKTLLRLARNTGKAPFKSQHHLEEYAGVLDPKALSKRRPGLIGLLASVATIDVAACEKLISNPDESWSKYINQLAIYCHSSSGSNDQDPLMKYIREVQPKDCNEFALMRIINAIDAQATFRDFSAHERSEILQFLELAVKSMETQRNAYETEALYTKLQRGQSLLKPESWVLSFPVE